MGDLETAEFSAGGIHGFTELNSFEIRKSSAGLGWPTAYFSVQSEKPYSASFKGVPSVFIAIINDGSLRADISIDEAVQHLQGSAGSVGILADDVPFKFDLYSHIDTTHLYLKRSLIEEVASGIYNSDPGCVEIVNKFCIFDPVVETICKEIQQSFDEDPLFSFSYVDYLIRAIAAHLLRHHSNLAFRREQSSPNAGLGLRLLNRTRELVESRLAERLAITELAAGTGISADHFGRLFKQSMGVTLHQFIIRRRIDRASYLLTNTSKPIIQIAHECGFADQVHLTRVFGRVIGTTPAAFRSERKK